MVRQYNHYPFTNIQHPHPHDVVCRRGSSLSGHIGTAQWKTLVADNKKLYIMGTRKGNKLLLAKSIVAAIRYQVPPGRFIEKGEDGLWNDIGDHRAVKKTSQALRENAPSIRERVLQNIVDNPTQAPPPPPPAVAAAAVSPTPRTITPTLLLPGSPMYPPQRMVTPVVMPVGYGHPPPQPNGFPMPMPMTALPYFSPSPSVAEAARYLGFSSKQNPNSNDTQTATTKQRQKKAATKPRRARKPAKAAKQKGTSTEIEKAPTNKKRPNTTEPIQITTPKAPQGSRAESAPAMNANKHQNVANLKNDDHDTVASRPPPIHHEVASPKDFIPSEMNNNKIAYNSTNNSTLEETQESIIPQNVLAHHLSSLASLSSSSPRARLIDLQGATTIHDHARFSPSHPYDLAPFAQALDPSAHHDEHYLHFDDDNDEDLKLSASQFSEEEQSKNDPPMWDNVALALNQCLDNNDDDDENDIPRASLDDGPCAVANEDLVERNFFNRVPSLALNVFQV